MAKNIVKRITSFNKGRDPELLKLKYEVLNESPFRFFRGTCHLFYEDIPKKSFLLKSPPAWICGDLHLENFGSFKGNNRLAYFDMNDFDESLLGPCLLDVARLCTSVYLASGMIKLNNSECGKLVKTLLESYSENLSQGYIRFIERDTAHGVVKEFLEKVVMRKRSDLLKKRLDYSGKHVVIKEHTPIIILAKESEKKRVKKSIERWVKHNRYDEEFFRVIDVANRANGTGSIGIKRHIVLVNGKGIDDGYYLLDIKEALLPSPLHSLKLKQPKWKNEAERLICIQRRVQSASPAFLSTLQMDDSWFIVKELQPLEDKIDFPNMEHDIPGLLQLVKNMGQIVAWNNLRSGGRQGSAIADKMIRFGEKMNKIQGEILSYTAEYAHITEKYWRDYKHASLHR